jgi:ATP-dependent Clp protease ATP-binding subunit ClpA
MNLKNLVISFYSLMKFIQLLVQVELQGSLDASNMFKPALARGEIQVIGATTLDEFRQYVEKDGALERQIPKSIG